jgi:tetratricopeptide (TPR) repeat protein
MKRRTKLSLVAVVGVGLAACGAWLWAESGRSEARALAKYGLWPEVRQALDKYLWLHPRDFPSRLLYAEALVKDGQLLAEEALPRAIAHLQAIPDTAPEGPRARTQEGRIELFLLHHPSRAEGLFRQAIELDPEMPEPYYLLWKLKDLTGRAHLAEPEFWKVYEFSALPVRGIRLREWYMSQFYPATANPLLDRLMGLVPPERNTPDQVEAFRLLGFRNAEPESPLGYAALARWFQAENDARAALDTLDKDAAKVPDAESDPFYLATLISILIELGEFDRADRCFERWPEPHSGYEYWLTRGRVLQEIRGEYAEAVRAYDLALAEWPGQVDWRTRNRKANCLARLRDQAGAARERERSKVLEQLMDEKVHQELRYAMGFLDDPKQLQKVVDFYRKIDRPREAAAWSEHIARIQAPPASTP